MRQHSKSCRRVLIGLTSSALVLSCAEKKDNKKGGGANGSASPTTLSLKIRNAGGPAAGLSEPSAFGLVGAGNLSFTPESFKLWINTVVLQNDEGLSNQFYVCDTNEAECEVDFGDTASIARFESRLSALPVSPGTFTKVWLSCSPSSGGYIKIKGQTQLADGTIRYTSDPAVNNGETVTSDFTKAGDLKIGGLDGCGITMPLSKPLVIAPIAPPTEGETETTAETAQPTNLTMTVFSNLKFVTFFVPMGSPGMGGCRLSDANVAARTSGPAFCANYPSVFPYFGETTPTVEYYKVANSKTSSAGLVEADSNVLVKVIKDSEGVPFWASFNNFYLESTVAYGTGDTGISGYANAVTNFAVNADGTLTMKSQDNGFSAFQRGSHEGNVSGGEVVGGAGTGNTVTYKYKAFPFNP